MRGRAGTLRKFQLQSPYAKDEDLVFASPALSGKRPELRAEPSAVDPRSVWSCSPPGVASARPDFAPDFPDEVPVDGFLENRFQVGAPVLDASFPYSPRSFKCQALVRAESASWRSLFASKDKRLEGAKMEEWAMEPR